jgi:hypothetical protein
VILSVTAPLSLEPSDLDERFRHELAHLALDEAMHGRPLPRWFQEGFATYSADEDTHARLEMLITASLRQRTIRIADLEPNFPADAPEASLAYAEAADFVRFLHATSAKAFAGAIDHLGRGEPFEAAIASSYGADMNALELAWRRDMARRYSFLPVLFAGLALWAVWSAALFLRRVRSRKAIASLRRARRADGTPRPRSLSARERLLRDPAMKIVAARGARDEAGELVLQDPEIPKVEHDGRWYTLH